MKYQHLQKVSQVNPGFAHQKPSFFSRFSHHGTWFQVITPFGKFLNFPKQIPIFLKNSPFVQWRSSPSPCPASSSLFRTERWSSARKSATWRGWNLPMRQSAESFHMTEDSSSEHPSGIFGDNLGYNIFFRTKKRYSSGDFEWDNL